MCYIYIYIYYILYIIYTVVSPEVRNLRNLATLRCSRSTSTKPDDIHTWCVGKPLPVAFQRAICEYHRETLRSVAKCANLEFVTMSHFSQPQIGAIVCERPSTRTKNPNTWVPAHGSCTGTHISGLFVRIDGRSQTIAPICTSNF